MFVRLYTGGGSICQFLGVFFRPLFCVVASLRASAGACKQQRRRCPSIKVHPAGSLQSTQTNHGLSPSCQVLFAFLQDADVYERRSGSLAGEGEGKRDLEGFAVEGAPLMRRNQFPGEERNKRACEDRKQPRGRGGQALCVLVIFAYPSAVLRLCRWRSNNPSPCTVRG